MVKVDTLVEVVQVLLTARAAVEPRCRHDFTPLLYACKHSGGREAARLLLAAKATPDLGREDEEHVGFTPLHSAAAEGLVETARLLLAANAEVDALTQTVWAIVVTIVRALPILIRQTKTTTVRVMRVNWISMISISMVWSTLKTTVHSSKMLVREIAMKMASVTYVTTVLRRQTPIRRMKTTTALATSASKTATATVMASST